MGPNDLSMVNFNSEELRDITSFCKLNELDVTEFIKSCFDKGYQIEKYGLLTVDGQAVIEKEVIKEVPVEVIKEKIVEITKEVEVPIEVIKEVIIEKPVETIKEVIVEKEVYVNDDTEINELLLKIQQLENRPPKVIEKEVPVEKIVEVEKVVEVVKEVDNKEKQKMLQDTIQKLRDDIRKKDESILQLEKNIVELKETQGPVRGQFMRSSNLNDNLYR